VKLLGKCSWFGGPDDTGVAPDEGLAFIYELDDAPHLFLPEQPPGTTGLARRLDPEKFYIACRWDYEQTSKEELLELRVVVRAPKTGKQFIAEPADWGPHEEKTGRVADLSPGLMAALGITTDDEVEVSIPVVEEDRAMTVVISSGHGLKIRGASGYLDEVDQARRVVPAVAARLRRNGCQVFEFHDDTSTTQQQNLETIVDYHNSQARDLDVSVHFNAYETTDEPMGTEVLYVSQSGLAAQLAAAIAAAGDLIDRGGKYRSNLYFLNNTTAPAVLLEVCFVDSSADAALYLENFEDICNAIADAINSPLVAARQP
jgi:N-acetylmuramoyl-L-alanine amidase